MSDQYQYVPPPPPPAPVIEGPVLSLGQTITGIFFEPGNVFASFRNKPRFLVVLIISIILFSSFFVVYTQKIGFERIQKEALEKSPRAADMTPEQKDLQLKMSSGLIAKVITYASLPVIGVLIAAIGAAIYLLGGMMMGGRMNYWQALGVWVYSSFPPLLVMTILNFVLMFILDPDSYDVVHAQRRGLVNANLRFLVDPKASPGISTFLGSLDLIAIYGLVLAAIGLRKAGKLSSGAAWAVVLVIFSIGVIARVGFSFFTGAM